MHYRIDRLVTGDNLPVLFVSGRLHAHALATLRDLLSRETEMLALDLKEVTLIDREVVLFLAASEARGIELRQCPAYIREWIDQERHAG